MEPGTCALESFWMPAGRLGPLSLVPCFQIWLWVKNRCPKWNTAKWNPGLKPAMFWWFNFDPRPYGSRSKGPCKEFSIR